MRRKVFGVYGNIVLRDFSGAAASIRTQLAEEPTRHIKVADRPFAWPSRGYLSRAPAPSTLQSLCSSTSFYSLPSPSSSTTPVMGKSWALVPAGGGSTTGFEGSWRRHPRTPGSSCSSALALQRASEVHGDAALEIQGHHPHRRLAAR